MPPPGKSTYMRGGMSTPAYGPTPASSFSSYRDGSFQSRGPPEVHGDERLPFSGPGYDNSVGIKWNPRHSMAFNSAKGLLNPVGENNCFLNCAVQVFWHLDVFRRNFRLLSGHACLGSSCVFCSLKAVFAQYQFSERPVLPSDSLRRALANTFADQQRFQMGFMDDASECFENILLHIHRHVAPDEPDDNCKALHCLTHQKFTMKIKEQVLCQCRSVSGELLFDQMVHYVATTALMTKVHQSRSERLRGKSRSFGQLIKDAKNDGETRKCSSNCGRYAAIHRTLTNTPEIISIGFIWDSERPRFEHIRGVVNAVSTELRPNDLFDSAREPQPGFAEPFQLVGVICYYSHHYSTFFFHSKMKTWVLFDDAKILEIGPNWRSVADRCCHGHYQPLLLLYTKTTTSPIETSAAPSTTFVQKKSELPSQSHRNCEYKQVYFSPLNETIHHELIRNPNDEHHHVHHSSDMNGSFKLSESRSTLVDSMSNASSGDGSMDETWKKPTDFERTSVDFVRQPSYLYAITGPKSFFSNEAYSSYVAAIDNASGERMTANRAGKQESEGLPYGGPPSKYVTNQYSMNSGGSYDSRRNGSTHDSVYNTLPYASRFQSSERSNHGYLPRKSHGSRVDDEWDCERPGSAPCGRLILKPGGVAARTIEDDDLTTETQYISAAKVQNVLMSQGLKARRCFVRSADQKTSNIQGLSLQSNDEQRIPQLKIAGCHSNTQLLSDSVENVSVGSHKDSGYRSGESNDDRGSPNSILSSPSLESGEFLPARNAQLIARNFMKPERSNYPDISGITTSLDNLSSGSSSLRSSGSSDLRNAGYRRPQRVPTMSTIEECDGRQNKILFNSQTNSSKMSNCHIGKNENGDIGNHLVTRRPFAPSVVNRRVADV